MTDVYKSDDLLFRPESGTQIGTMRLIGSAAMLGNEFSIMEGEVGPNQLLMPHTHQHEDQAVFVIEGTLEFEVGGKDGLRFQATAGDYVLKPRKVKHGFWNKGETPCRYIELSGGRNFENFVQTSDDENNLQTFMRAPKEHGVQFHPQDSLRLMAEHKLTGVVGFGHEEAPKTVTAIG